MKKIISTLAIVFLLLSHLPLIPNHLAEEPTNLYVDDDNTTPPWLGTQDDPYYTIRQAVENASNGDTIYVYKGTYYTYFGDYDDTGAEGITIDKPLTLLGEDATTTIIDGRYDDGGNYSDIVLIDIKNTSMVTISGFTLQHVDIATNCIHAVNSHNITISNCIVQTNENMFVWSRGRAGIYFENCSYSSIKNNNIKNFTYFGININKADHIEISNNSINGKYDKMRGISLWGTTQALIAQNTLEDLIGGIDLHGEVKNCIIQANIIQTYNPTNLPRNQGIFLSDNNVSNNTFTSNTIELFERAILCKADYNLFRDNIIKHNAEYGINITGGQNNTLYHNTFENNTHNGMVVHGIDNGQNNQWDNEYPTGGNYWDDYAGSDADGDGIGDTPYQIIGSSQSTDDYPFIEANGWNNRPPLIITTLDEILEGQSFTVTVTNSDSIPLEDVMITAGNQTYPTNTSGQTIISAPTVTQDTELVVVAEKPGFSIATKTVAIINTKTIHIASPDTITSEDYFTVRITSDGIILQNAKINFQDIAYYTNSEGTLTLQAPTVQKPTTLVLSATKEGYLSSQHEILIQPPAQPIQTGLSGTVTDLQGNPVKNAQICIQLTPTEQLCTFTTTQGTYHLDLQPASYTLYCNRQGYQPYSTIITVAADTSTQHPIVLKKDVTPPAPTDINEQLIEEKIINEAKTKVGAKIQLKNVDTHVTYFSSDIAISSLTRSETTASFHVSADDDTPGTILAFYIGKGTLADLDNLEVLYDGKIIDETTHLDTLFDLEPSEQPRWLRVNTQNGLYILVQVPHFSDHIITITSPQDLLRGLSGASAAVFYLVILTILAIIYLVPFFLIRKVK